MRDQRLRSFQVSLHCLNNAFHIQYVCYEHMCTDRRMRWTETTYEWWGYVRVRVINIRFCLDQSFKTRALSDECVWHVWCMCVCVLLVCLTQCSMIEKQETKTNALNDSIHMLHMFGLNVSSVEVMAFHLNCIHFFDQNSLELFLYISYEGVTRIIHGFLIIFLAECFSEWGSRKADI